MTYQAFIDDSYDSDNVFVRAGYVSTKDRWKKFSDEWAGILGEPPSWRFLRMADRSRREGARTWDKIQKLHACIDRHAMAQVSIVIDRRLFSSISLQHGPTNYNEHLRHWTVSLLLFEMRSWLERDLGIKGPVEYIFDRQDDVSGVLAEAWPMALKNNPPDQMSALAAEPVFANDKDWPPLQAADFIAYWTRKSFLRTRDAGKPITFHSPKSRTTWSESGRVPVLVIEPTAEMIAHMLDRTRLQEFITSGAADDLPPHVRVNFPKDWTRS